MTDDQWRQQAACIGQPPNMFFPDRTDRADRDDAKAVCAVCPVRVECLTEAVTHRYHGIWGGTNDEDRKKVVRWWRRDRRRALAIAERLATEHEDRIAS
jgi:WhiB family redox-sensing transcriptional regulator